MVGRIWLIILNTPCTRAGAADPIAFGQPAPGLGMKGCLDVWFLWLVGWLADWLLSGCLVDWVFAGLLNLPSWG